VEPSRLDSDRASLDSQSVDFVIVTALEEERDALLNKLPAPRKTNPSEDDIRLYYSADLAVTFDEGNSGTYSVVVMCLPAMGRVQATSATADAIRRWHPRYVVLVGIAGGIAAKGVSPKRKSCLPAPSSLPCRHCVASTT
jgi:nucleoside phosphorylase